MIPVLQVLDYTGLNKASLEFSVGMQIVGFWWAPSGDTPEDFVTVGICQKSRWEQVLFSIVSPDNS